MIRAVNLEVSDSSNTCIGGRSVGSNNNLIIARLDREEVASFHVQFCAKDLGAPPLKSEINVVIHLTDINDNYPEFPESARDEIGREFLKINRDVSSHDFKLHASGAHQIISVPEDLAVGKMIGHVFEAIDRDERGNSEVFYHLISIAAGEKDVGHVFDLNKRTGKILLTSPLDREMIDRYVLHRNLPVFTPNQF